MKVISMVGASGSGKSTMAAYIFWYIRSNYPHISCELVTEFAKDLVWDGVLTDNSNQTFITATQYQRLLRLKGKVDIVVTDTSLLNGLVYLTQNDPPSLSKLIVELFRQFDNYCIFFWLDSPNKDSYEQTGRVQTYEEALEIESKLHDKIITYVDSSRICYSRKKEVPEDFLTKLF